MKRDLQLLFAVFVSNPAEVIISCRMRKHPKSDKNYTNGKINSEFSKMIFPKRPPVIF